jgi:hypothetical protein
MNRRLDIENVDAALRRAAFKAVHGTREERSGRFLPTKPRLAPSAPLRESKRLKSKRREA